MALQVHPIAAGKSFDVDKTGTVIANAGHLSINGHRHVVPMAAAVITGFGLSGPEETALAAFITALKVGATVYEPPAEPPREPSPAQNHRAGVLADIEQTLADENAGVPELKAAITNLLEII